MSTLVLADRGTPYWTPWGEDVLEAVSGRLGGALVDRSRPVVDQVREADAVIDLGGQVNAELAAAAAGRVRLWQFTSVGYDHWDVASLLRHGVPTANVPGSTSATGLAELAIVLAALVLRRYREIDAAVRAGEPYISTGGELAGRTMLIIGLGASGRALAVRAKAFGMQVVAVRRAGPDAGIQRYLGLDGLHAWTDLDELLPSADVVSLHVPATPDTVGLIDARRIALLRQDAVLVNVSRGALVDEPALLAALDAGTLGGAGLDVVAREPVDAGDPILVHPRVVVTPHVAGQTFNTSRARARFAANNVARALAGEPLQSLIREPKAGAHPDERSAS